MILEPSAAAPGDIRSGAVPGLMPARGMAGPDGVGRFVREVGIPEDGRVHVHGAGVSARAGMQ